MKALGFLAGTVCVVCSVGLSLLAMYVEWLFIREDFIQVLNPLLHIQVLLSMITQPLTWILFVGALLSYFSLIGISNK